MNKLANIEDFSREGGQLAQIDPGKLLPLPPPYDKMEKPHSMRFIIKNMCGAILTFYFHIDPRSTSQPAKPGYSSTARVTLLRRPGSF